MKAQKISFTTDGAGAATATSTQWTEPSKVYAVQLVDGDLVDGVDVTVTFEQGDLSIPVLAKLDFNTDQMVYPRVLQALNTDGTALTTHTQPLACGFAKVVIAAGGATKSGSVIIYTE